MARSTVTTYASLAVPSVKVREQPSSIWDDEKLRLVTVRVILEHLTPRCRSDLDVNCKEVISKFVTIIP